MIKNLIMIYINITNQDSLLEEIVNDGRSYSDDLIMDLGRTAFKKKLLEANKFEELQVLITRLAKIQVQAQNWNKIEESAPDEFMCELMSTLMSDPVKMPLGGQVIDRATVKKLILSNGEKDPFSNTPLTMKDLVEMPELKKKITDWVDGKLFELAAPKLGKIVSFGDEDGMREDSIFNDEDDENTNTGMRFDINDHLN
jgi:ubiquitin conjugation factor E4 B